MLCGVAVSASHERGDGRCGHRRAGGTTESGRGAVAGLSRCRCDLLHRVRERGRGVRQLEADLFYFCSWNPLRLAAIACALMSSSTSRVCVCICCFCRREVAEIFWKPSRASSQTPSFILKTKHTPFLLWFSVPWPSTNPALHYPGSPTATSLGDQPLRGRSPAFLSPEWLPSCRDTPDRALHLREVSLGTWEIRDAATPLTRSAVHTGTSSDMCAPAGGR